jgi:hypothetical protein
VAWEEFKQCAQERVNTDIDSWREVINDLKRAYDRYTELPDWLKKWVTSLGVGAAVLKFLATLTGVGEAVVGVAVTAAAAVGMSVGEVLNVIGSCYDKMG